MSQSASRIARSYLWSILIWLSLAPLAAGEDRVSLLDTGLCPSGSYLELEQMRLGDRLQISWDVDLETREILVPQLILQPLVENAILHGISCCREGGWIRIVSRKIGDRMELEIKDS